MQKKKGKISEDELYEDVMEELRSRITQRKELLKLAHLVLQENITEENVDWRTLCNLMKKIGGRIYARNITPKTIGRRKILPKRNR